MGSLNFYIEVKADEQVLSNMLQQYNSNQMHQRLFGFGVFETFSEENYHAGFEAYIDDFLPACHLIYGFLSRFASHDLYIRANGIEHLLDFPQKSDFCHFVYKAWEKKIDAAYARFGTLVIDYKQYYKTRNRLYRKHYMKL